MKNDDIERLDFSNWPLPDPFLIELGRLACLWTSLEGQLDLSLGKFAGYDNLTDPRPFILVKHASFPQKLDILSALCEQLVAEFPQLGTYASVVTKLRAAQKQRNRFMHNGMAFTPASRRVEIATGSARGSLKTSVDPVSTADIRRAAMDVHVAMLSLHELLTGHAIKPKWERPDA